MRKAGKIEFAKLLGFAAVSDQLPGSVDFRDEHFAAKLGAKVGDKVWAACDFPCDSHAMGEADPGVANPCHKETEA